MAKSATAKYTATLDEALNPKATSQRFVGGLAGVFVAFAKSRNLTGPITADDPEDAEIRRQYEEAKEPVNVTEVCHKKAKIIGNFQDE